MSTRRAGWCCLLALAATVSGGAAPAADEPPAEVPAEVLEVAQAVVGAIRADDLRAVAPWTVADEGEFDVEWLLDEDDDSRLMFSAAMLLYHPPGVVTDVGEPEQVEDGLVVYPLRKRFDETLHLVLLNTDDGWRWHLAATARATGRLATAGDADLAPPETLEPDALVARFQARVARGNLPVTTMPWLDDLGAPLLTDHSRTLVEELADIHGEGDAPMLLAMMYGLTWSPESERTLGEPRPLRLPENTPAWTVPMTSHFDLPLRLVVRREDGAWRLDLWNSARLSIGWPLEAPGEVLLPGRETAEQSLNNLKQLGLAMMMYAQDNDEQLPPAAWHEALVPYLQDDRLFHLGERRNAYAYHAAVADLTFDALPNPAGVVMLFETAAEGDPDGAAVAWVGGPELMPAEGWHQGRVAVAFADGHVELVEPERLAELLGADEAGLPPGGATDAARRQALQRLLTALTAYVREHDGKLPNVATWADDLLPYLDGDRSAFAVPVPVPVDRPDAEPLASAYAFNLALSGAPADVVLRPDETIVLFECGLGDWNTPGAPDALRADDWHGNRVYAATVSGRMVRLSVDELRRVLGGW